MKNDFSFYYLAIILMAHLLLILGSDFLYTNSDSLLVESSKSSSEFRVQFNKNNKPILKSIERIIEPVIKKFKKKRVSSKQKKVKFTEDKSSEITGKNKAQETTKVLDAQEGKKVVASYVEELKVYLEQNKTYPRVALRLKHSGIVRIKLEILKNGTFGSIQVHTPAPFNTLNEAAVKLLKKLGKFKPLPDVSNRRKEFIVPISYKIKGKNF